MSSETPALSAALERLAARADLEAPEAEAALAEIMEGRSSDVQTAAFLMGLRAKGATPAEVAGGVRALRRSMVPVDLQDDDRAIDTCGTGGGRLTTFNISTAAAFVVAAAGVPVAKHGNRSFSSRCGSADVLEELGIAIEHEPETARRLIQDFGFGFLYAPRYHPAMRHVGPVRRELAVPTIMNLLGPLTNPARVRRQVVGVSDPDLLPLIAGALAELGHRHALVVHGAPGIDELSPLGPTRVIRVEDGAMEAVTFDPEAELGWTDLEPEELSGGAPERNAQLIRQVLSGRGPRTARAAVVLNAAAGLYVAGVVDSIGDGVERAERVIDEGAAADRLEGLREASRAS